MAIGRLKEMKMGAIVSNFRELCGTNSSQIGVIRLVEIELSGQPCVISKGMSFLNNLAHP